METCEHCPSRVFKYGVCKAHYPGKRRAMLLAEGAEPPKRKISPPVRKDVDGVFMKHGTYTGYVRGCREACCTEAMRAYRKALNTKREGQAS